MVRCLSNTSPRRNALYIRVSEAFGEKVRYYHVILYVPRKKRRFVSVGH